MISADDASVRPLSAKLLERPRLLTRIRWAIDDLERCHLVPYVSTELELAVGDALGIPVHGADPALAYLGTKSGSRELFARAGVPHPLGIERITQSRGRGRGHRPPARRRPELGQVVVKLDAGVSGEGNAIVELDGLPRPGARTSRAGSAERFDAMQPRGDRRLVRRLPGAAVARRRRRGADRRHRAAQPERPARADARRRGADRLDA